jgi:uncharacterized protein YjbJ (UPF0337 family)
MIQVPDGSRTQSFPKAKRRSETNRFRADDGQAMTDGGPAAELIFRWKLIATTGRIPSPRARPATLDVAGLLPATSYFCVLSRRRKRVVVQTAPAKQETTMNWDRVEGNWKQIKGKAQQQWGKLTNDDLNLVEGKRTELVGRIQERYGIQRDEAERQIDSWLRNLT